jgi:hypothetical protein
VETPFSQELGLSSISRVSLHREPDPNRNCALADLLVRYDKAAQWTHDNRSDCARKYSGAVGLDLKIAELAQSRLLRLPIPLDEKVVAAEQRLADCSQPQTRFRRRPLSPSGWTVGLTVCSR